MLYIRFANRTVCRNAIIIDPRIRTTAKEWKASIISIRNNRLPCKPVAVAYFCQDCNVRTFHVFNPPDESMYGRHIQTLSSCPVVYSIARTTDTCAQRCSWKTQWSHNYELSTSIIISSYCYQLTKLLRLWMFQYNTIDTIETIDRGLPK